MYQFIAIALSIVPAANAHIGVWASGMFCRNGPQTLENMNSNTVVNPLYNLPFRDYFFGNGITNGVSNHCWNYPPPEGEFLELPAGGSFDVQMANNRAFSSMGFGGAFVGQFPDGKSHPEYDAAGYKDTNCVPSPLLHAENHADVAGSAFAISYVSDYSQVTQENMVVFSVRYGTPWYTEASFDVPADMPACPAGGCMCGWGWVPNGCGQPNEYLQLFRCQVTGAKADAPAVSAGKAPVWCESNPDACVKGAKQMIYWNQKENNNINVASGTGRAGEQADGKQKSPGYNMKLGWADGAQNDIFVTGGASAAPAAASSFSQAQAVASSQAAVAAPSSSKAPVAATPAAPSSVLNVAPTPAISSAPPNNAVVSSNTPESTSTVHVKVTVTAHSHSHSHTPHSTASAPAVNLGKGPVIIPTQSSAAPNNAVVSTSVPAVVLTSESAVVPTSASASSTSASPSAVLHLGTGPIVVPAKAVAHAHNGTCSRKGHANKRDAYKAHAKRITRARISGFH